MKKRLDYMDIVRGICIIYMIAGHVGFGNKFFDHYIHAFHMPLFFIVSGFFYKRKNESLLLFIKKISKKVLVPYLIWSFVALIIDNYTLLGRHTGFLHGLKIIFTTNNNEIPIAGALWFLTAFLICNIIFKILDMTIKNEKAFIITSFIIMICGVYLERILKINLWLSTNAALVGVGLMSIGFIIKKKDLINKMMIKNNLFFIIIIIINTFLIIKTGYVNMRLNIYPNILLFIINIILSFVVYINIGTRMESIKKITKLNEYIKLLGKESIIPLCVNQFIILLYITLIYNNLAQYLPLLCMIIIRFLILFITIISIILLVKVVDKTKLKILFGK